MSPLVAIVGRPNVGKSTLFNRLAGRKAAIVHDTPGVTRDRQEISTEWNGLAFRLVDTAGFDEAATGSLADRMTAKTQEAISDADLCLFLVDAREGITTLDDTIAGALRRAGKAVILLANKSEGATADLSDALRWGMGEPIAVSAEHAIGMAELYDALAPFAADTAPPEDDASAKPLKLAIVGRPNVGKSTLFNQLLGEDRSLTGPEAGITRDAIVVPWAVDGRAVLLHDTAGLRKRARSAGETLERLAVASTLTAIRFADCVVLVVDATAPFEKQDLTIADLIAREGRAIVLAINKWDLLPQRTGAITDFRRELDRLLPQIAGAPLAAVSALTGEGVARLAKAVAVADEAWNRRIATAELNRFLARALERHPPPAIKGRRVRVRYMTQAKARPPTFVLFGTQLNALPQSWLRYLQNELRAGFDLPGTPLRLMLRTAKNPYTEQ